MGRRVISNLIAILIVVLITIGIGVAVGVVIPNLLIKNTPKKGILSLGGSEAFFDPSTRDLWITVRGHYIGSEPIRVKRVLVFAGTLSGGTSITCYLYMCPPDIICRTYPSCFLINDPEGCVYVCTEPVNPAGCRLDKSFSCSSPSAAAGITISAITPVSEIKPNSYFKILLKGTASFSSPPVKLLVVVEYCFNDGTCFDATELVPVTTR